MIFHYSIVIQSVLEKNKDFLFGGLRAFSSNDLALFCHLHEQYEFLKSDYASQQLQEIGHLKMKSTFVCPDPVLTHKSQSFAIV